MARHLHKQLADSSFVRECAAAIRREHRGGAERFVAARCAELLRAGNLEAQQTWLRIGQCLGEMSGHGAHAADAINSALRIEILPQLPGAADNSGALIGP